MHKGTLHEKIQQCLPVIAEIQAYISISKNILYDSKPRSLLLSPVSTPTYNKHQIKQSVPSRKGNHKTSHTSTLPELHSVFPTSLETQKFLVLVGWTFLSERSSPHHRQYYRYWTWCGCFAQIHNMGSLVWQESSIQ